MCMMHVSNVGIKQTKMSIVHIIVHKCCRVADSMFCMHEGGVADGPSVGVGRQEHW